MTDNDYIGKDKVKHFCVCFVLAVFHPYLAIGAALGKEYGDKCSSGNHWCWWDIAADACGIILGSILWYYIW